MNERDILAQKDFAVKEALAKGLSEGEAKGKRETAKNMKAMGISLEQIVCATGLSREEIQSL